MGRPKGSKNGQRNNALREYTGSQSGDTGVDTTGIDPGDLPGTEDGITDGDEGLFIDPSSLGGTKDTGTEDTGTEETRARRRSPKGTRRKATAPKTTLEGLENVLLSLHMMGANFLKCPELELDPKEAAAMSAAVARVSALYDIEASETTLAWVNLAVVVGPIYAFRFFAVKARLAMEASDKRAKVIPINGQ